MIFADAHAHVNPMRGLRPAELASRFVQAGGWFIALISSSPWDYGIDATDVRAAYDAILRAHEAACREVAGQGLKVACLAGFHPSDVDKLIEMGLKAHEVLDVGLSVVKGVIGLCKAGRLQGVGEVGRQHYRTSAERVLVSELILEEAIVNAQEADCVVHLHLEDVGPETALLTHRVLTRLGVKPSPRIVFHHARPSMIEAVLALGYSATVPGRPQAVAEALRHGRGFMVESDFPGIELPKSVAPWDLPRYEQEALREQRDPEGALRSINVDSIVRAYGVKPP
ncbi:MAG: TatD family hydrolase [Acidilobus sp.]